MNPNTELFIEAFNRLESAMQMRLGRPKSASFSSLVSEAAKKDPFVRRHRSLLDSFRELRNVLVHEEGNRIIAVPTEAAVRGLQKFEEIYTKPSEVYKLFHQKVISVEAGQLLKYALDQMRHHKYSNLPVYQNGTCIGLLNCRGVTQWLLGHYSDEGVLDTGLCDVKVGQVLKEIDRVDELKTVSRHTDILSFLEMHNNNPSLSGVYLITENGKMTEKPLGLITEKDLALIYDRIDMRF